MELLGNRITVVLQAFQKLKSKLSLILNSTAPIDSDSIVNEFKNEIILALQVDAFSQTSLEIKTDSISIFTVSNGEGLLRTGEIVDTQYDLSTVTLSVVDYEDGEENTFTGNDQYLETIDQGVKLSFSREPTYFFTDPELNALEKMLRDHS